MAEFDPGQFLQVVLGERGMVHNRLQNQCLAPRDGSPVAAQNRTCRQLRTGTDIRTAADRRHGRPLAIEPSARARTGLAVSLGAAPPRRPEWACRFITCRTSAIGS